MTPHKAGLTLGAFLGLWHALWAILVATGAAQPLVNFIFWLHFITPPYQVGEFAFGRAVGLVLYASIVGYIVGWVIGYLLKKFRA